MPDLAEVAHGLTDAAIVYLAASVPFVVGGIAALSVAVVSALVWLCHSELRGGAAATRSNGLVR
jgi:hypothetical protein